MSALVRRAAGVGEHNLEVVRTARFATLGPFDERVRDLWFVLHGYRQLARRFLARFVPLDNGRRLLVAPEALSRFYVDASAGRHGPDSRVGATWMTREDRDHEIGDYVRYLDRLHRRVLDGLGRLPDTTVLLGFSQGCHTAARWAVLGSIRPDRLVLWGERAPADLPDPPARERLSGVRITVVHGTKDASLAELGSAGVGDRLSVLGIPWEHRTYDGGHEIDVDALLTLADAGS